MSARRGISVGCVRPVPTRTATDNHNLLGWNKPSMYKRRQAGNAGFGGGGNARPGGFVPPYVRKALDKPAARLPLQEEDEAEADARVRSGRRCAARPSSRRCWGGHHFFCIASPSP